jgi:hypothetical protein
MKLGATLVPTWKVFQLLERYPKAYGYAHPQRDLQYRIRIEGGFYVYASKFMDHDWKDHDEPVMVGMMWEMKNLPTRETWTYVLLRVKI